MFKSGFVTIIGRPNVGKSTLLNAILGEKISIVSAKPQTTRNSIRGVYSAKDCQIIFIDTPGIHAGRGAPSATFHHKPSMPHKCMRRKVALGEFMASESASALSDVDAVVYMCDAGAKSMDADRPIIDVLKTLKRPVVLAMNKVDAMDKPALLPLIAGYAKVFPFHEIIPISALKRDGVDLIIAAVKKFLPDGPRYFPEDAVTDQPERFIVAEIIREKIFHFTKDEVPYSTAVVVDGFKEKKGKGVVVIDATISVEKGSQKGILIGKDGAMLKRIGIAARLDIEGLLGVKVFLTLFVRVQKDWTKNPADLKEFGY
ncbi:MAG: GTPase Era [Deltaproteobacteria bacterium]|nr:GTPase Era [Deltaproteobacteria bacterium]